MIAQINNQTLTGEIMLEYSEPDLPYQAFLKLRPTYESHAQLSQAWP